MVEKGLKRLLKTVWSGQNGSSDLLGIHNGSSLIKLVLKGWKWLKILLNGSNWIIILQTEPNDSRWIQCYRIAKIGHNGSSLI